nr:FtsK/SpoIIIE domain-containing protein [Conyzicola lurida]
MTAHARRARLVGGVAALPAELAFDECGGRETGERPAGLDCVVGVTAAGPLRLDLAAHGPHAVVGGTTGSGKSELLVAWVLAMARAHPPRAASVLLVDFKGGSAFAALAALPHCVGVITDLDETGAARALESLAAELRRRERVLAAAGAKSVDAPGTGGAVADLPRLVIVVDEFAAMVAGFPELHALFGDVAARGRSLGVHLVLCTQRPAGVIRDAVLANSGLRVSLRVNNRGDSVAVIGSDEAAALPLSPRGRAWVAADGDAPVLAQFPLVAPQDIDAVARRWSADSYRPHRPWLDPLPDLVRPGDLAPGEPGGIPVGRLDDPARQSQPTAFYRPATHGNLLVVGGAGAGKTGVLDTLAAAASPIRVSRVPHDIEGAWDVLTATLAAVRGGDVAGSTLVLLDDLDTLVARFPEEYEGAVLELVTQGLREGPGRGIHWALTAQRLTSGLHSVAALCGSRLLLRLPSRQEHVLAGGDGEHFSSALPPGAGRWEGLRVQIAHTEAEPRPHPSRPAPPVLDLSRPLAVVTRRPAQFADRLRRSVPALSRSGAVSVLGAEGIGVSTGGSAAVVGDAQAWLSSWGSIAALRATHTLVVEGCGAAEFRSITRVTELPPPLAPTPGGGTPAAFWALDPDGRITRATLPRAPGP